MSGIPLAMYLPSEFKVNLVISSLEDPAGLAAWVDMVHDTSTLVTRIHEGICSR